MAVAEALAEVSIEVDDSIPFPSTEAGEGGVDLVDSVQRVIDSQARVLILLADSNDGIQFLEALSDADVPSISTSSSTTPCVHPSRSSDWRRCPRPHGRTSEASRRNRSRAT